jgi:hypothetical protein
MKVQWKFGRTTAWLGCAVALLLPPGLRSDSGQPSSPSIGYEVVGQVLNPSASQSFQYGYLNLVPGIDRITTSDGVAISEATALFTFFNDTATERVINNGPIRVVDRTGAGAIYFGSGNATFETPDSFRNGTPVQSYRLRHQVVIDTSTGYFTTTFEITITSVQTFQIDGESHRLGHPGGVYRLNVSGKLASPTPSAYIAGAADGGGGDVMGND